MVPVACSGGGLHFPAKGGGALWDISTPLPWQPDVSKFKK